MKANSEYYTVAELIEMLQRMPQDAIIVGNNYADHVLPFRKNNYSIAYHELLESDILDDLIEKCVVFNVDW